MPKSKLTEKEKGELIIRLSQAFAQIKNTDEAAKLIVDLLTKAEIERVAIRLKIADLLIHGMSYDDIIVQLKVGRNTVGVVSEWLKLAGDGYRTILGRIESVPEIKSTRPIWTGMKHKYQHYYWPERLLAEIVYSASKKQKERLEKTIRSLNTKSHLYKDLSAIMAAEEDEKAFNDAKEKQKSQDKK